jgi:hypothetical protein
MINKHKKPMDYRVGDRVLVLLGDYKNKVGTVQGHDGNLLILSFDKDSEFKGIHFMNVIKWFERI